MTGIRNRANQLRALVSDNVQRGLGVLRSVGVTRIKLGALKECTATG